MEPHQFPGMRLPSRAPPYVRWAMMGERAMSDATADESLLDALLSLPVLRRTMVSPDGAWVAWTWINCGPAADVYAAPTDARHGPIRLTDSPDTTIMLSWSADSRAVLVAEDHGGDERVQLFRVDLAQPGVMTALTEASPGYYIHGGQLHPDGHTLFYAANVDPVSGAEIEQSLIYRHDLLRNERRVLARPQRASASAPLLNEAGSMLLYTRQDLNPAGSQIWLVDSDGQLDRELLNFGPATKVEASWLPDSRRVLFL